MAGALWRGGPVGKLTRLAFYMDRYGDDLEADFQDRYRLNLGELLRQWQFRRVLNLISKLPQACRFHAAVANDEEHVNAILEAQEGQPQEKSSPSLSEWAHSNDQLARIEDVLNGLISVTVKANGGNPGKIKPAQRPKTAFDDVRQRRLEERHKRLVSRVIRTARKVE